MAVAMLPPGRVGEGELAPQLLLDQSLTSRSPSPPRGCGHPGRPQPPGVGFRRGPAGSGAPAPSSWTRSSTGRSSPPRSSTVTVPGPSPRPCSTAFWISSFRTTASEVATAASTRTEAVCSSMWTSSRPSRPSSILTTRRATSAMSCALELLGEGLVDQRDRGDQRTESSRATTAWG